MGYVMRIVIGVLAIDQNQALLSLIFEACYFLNDFFVAQGFTHSLAIGSPETAIHAIVYTFIADVQRSKQYDSITVNFAFELPGTLFDFFDQLGIFGV